MDWMPIETAPKDGTRVLLFFPDSYGDVVTEATYDGRWQVAIMPSHGCGCCGDDDPDPTHWMPLPPKPTKEGE